VRRLAALVAALAIPAVALAATVEPGLYTGKRHGVSMRLRVTESLHVDYRLRFHWSCNRKPRRSNAETKPLTLPKLHSDGRFRHVEHGKAKNSRGSFRYRERIRGRVAADSAKGRYTAVLHYTNGRVCKAHNIAWSAKRRD